MSIYKILLSPSDQHSAQLHVKVAVAACAEPPVCMRAIDAPSELCSSIALLACRTCLQDLLATRLSTIEEEEEDIDDEEGEDIALEQERLAHREERHSCEQDLNA